MSMELIEELIDAIQRIRGEDDVSIYYACEEAKAEIRKHSVKNRQRKLHTAVESRKKPDVEKVVKVIFECFKEMAQERNMEFTSTEPTEGDRRLARAVMKANGFLSSIG